MRRVHVLRGHVKRTTTEICTHVAITELEEIHSATHPGARDDDDARDRDHDRWPDLSDGFEADFVRAVDLMRDHPQASPVMTSRGSSHDTRRGRPLGAVPSRETRIVVAG